MNELNTTMAYNEQIKKENTEIMAKFTKLKEEKTRLEQEVRKAKEEKHNEKEIDRFIQDKEFVAGMEYKEELVITD